jgi:hypothetical protein
MSIIRDMVVDSKIHMSKDLKPLKIMKVYIDVENIQDGKLQNENVLDKMTEEFRQKAKEILEK